MQNAKKFDGRITIGTVPGARDLLQLKELGYRTLVDVRDEQEKFGGLVEKGAEQVGLRYVGIPIRRDALRMQDVIAFYEAVFARGSAPLYVFSRFGKKPLAFLLLLEAAAKGEPVFKVFQRASQFGINLQGDICLQQLIVELINSGQMEPVVAAVRQLRPDLLVPLPVSEQSVAITGLTRRENAIYVALQDATSQWAESCDAATLHRTIHRILDRLEEF